MSRTRLPGKTRLRAAAYLLLAVLFALRCSVAWAAADVRPGGAEMARTAPVAAKTHAAALAAFKPAPAKCEAIGDSAPPLCASHPAVAYWSAPTAAPVRPSGRVLAGAPALPPPARGPPRLAA